MSGLIGWHLVLVDALRLRDAAVRLSDVPR